MADPRVLVTGGLGFVGSAIVRQIRDLHPEWTIIVLDQHPGPQHEDSWEFEYTQADITSPASVCHAFQQTRPQVVIHTAGVVPPLSERYGRRLEKLVKQVNVEGTRHVLDAAREAGCTGLVYTSSCCAVTDDMSKPYANIDERWPPSPQSSIYGESKVEAEALVLKANGATFSTCVLRPAVIFGEGDQQLVPPIHACIAKHETAFKIGNGTNLWDTVYVGNVADAHVLAAQNLLSSKSAAGEIFFIQNNEPISFREFSLAVWKEFGHYPPVEITIPEGLAWIVGLFAELFTRISGTPTTLSRGSVLDACAMRYASGEKARQLLGYRPRVGLEMGLKRSCQEYSRRLMAGSQLDAGVKP